jgi:phosphoglycolate phosphatase
VGKQFSSKIGSAKVLFPIARGSMQSVQQQIVKRDNVINLEVYATLKHSQVVGAENGLIIFTSPSNVEAFFESSGLGHYFEGHQCFGTKGLPKSENIREVVEQFGLQAPVYVGDTRGDFEASQKSGTPFIFATYGFGEVSPEEAPERLNQLTDLQQLL